MNIYIASDHAGYEMKNELKIYLSDLGYTVDDLGATTHNETDDYPDFVKPLASIISNNPEYLGIILGKSGTGEAISANRFANVRAMEYYGGNIDIVRLAREHNYANVISLGAGFVSMDDAKEAVRVFLETKFSNEDRHIRRIKKIEIE